MNQIYFTVIDFAELYGLKYSLPAIVFADFTFTYIFCPFFNPLIL